MHGWHRLPRGGIAETACLSSALLCPCALLPLSPAHFLTHGWHCSRSCVLIVIMRTMITDLRSSNILCVQAAREVKVR